MLNEFSVCSQRFGVKSISEAFTPEDAIVSFENMNQIKSFFNGAMKSQINSKSIHRIAKDIAPSYCCRNSGDTLLNY